MKRFLTFALAAASVGIMASTSFAAPSTTYSAGDAANGIAGAKHNLGRFNSNGVSTDGTTEICVFCHTPHHTNQSVAPAPLWNRGNQSTNFTAYGMTLGGTNITSIGSVSQACLSCHDGVTSFDNLVNAPGAGGVTPGGTTQGWRFWDDASTLGRTLGGANDIGISAGIGGLDGGRLDIGSGSGNYGTGAPGSRRANGSVVDLSNDHPMSVPYQSDRASLRPTSVVISGINLTAGLAGTTFDANNLSRNLWAIKGYISSTATINDLLRAGKVECSSCHDPHFANKTGASVDQGITGVGMDSPIDGLFLRRVGGNVGSGVCRTCHNK